MAKGLFPLTAEYAADVLSIWTEVCGPDVKPSDIRLSLEDAEDLFRPGRVAYGYEDESGLLQGFVAAVPLELDGIQLAELMVFFRPFPGRSAIALAAAQQLAKQLSEANAQALVTIVYERNEKGKQFYGRAGFYFDRKILFAGHPYELWKARVYAAR